MQRSAQPRDGREAGDAGRDGVRVVGAGHGGSHGDDGAAPRREPPASRGGARPLLPRRQGGDLVRRGEPKPIRSHWEGRSERIKLTDFDTVARSNAQSVYQDRRMMCSHAGHPSRSRCWWFDAVRFVLPRRVMMFGPQLQSHMWSTACVDLGRIVEFVTIQGMLGFLWKLCSFIEGVIYALDRLWFSRSNLFAHHVYIQYAAHP